MTKELLGDLAHCELLILYFIFSEHRCIDNRTSSTNGPQSVQTVHLLSPLPCPLTVPNLILLRSPIFVPETCSLESLKSPACTGCANNVQIAAKNLVQGFIPITIVKPKAKLVLTDFVCLSFSVFVWLSVSAFVCLSFYLVSRF